MSLVPDFEIGLWNAWLFMIIFPLQWLAAIILPKHIAEKAGHPADFKQDLKGKVLGRITETFWIGAILYSIFLPFDIGTVWFYIGLGAFIIGVAILILATRAVAQTADGKPFTEGIYRFSRHPMYLSMILIYMGVSIATASWLFLLITVITLFLQRFQMMQEERYCCEKFGDAYREYMNRTSRWVSIPKQVVN